MYQSVIVNTIGQKHEVIAMVMDVSFLFVWFVAVDLFGFVWFVFVVVCYFSVLVRFAI